MDPQALLKLCGEYQSFCRKISTVVSQQQVRGHPMEASDAHMACIEATLARVRVLSL
jgi:hypothetical protein